MKLPDPSMDNSKGFSNQEGDSSRFAINNGGATSSRVVVEVVKTEKLAKQMFYNLIQENNNYAKTFQKMGSNLNFAKNSFY